LLRGGGRFVADLVIPGELHCAIVRSPHAHAVIRSIDAARARAAPGVVAAFSGTDMAADRVGSMRALWAIRGTDGKPMAEPPRWALARERVRHVGEPVEGDADLVPYGTGTFGSRSIAVGGSALDRAAGKIIAKGKLIAAHLLEASAGDIDFADGVFAVAGTDRRLSFAQIAHAANVPHNFPHETLEPGLQEFAFSNGAHVCEVEIDPLTGETRVVGYWGVDDVGTVINPMIVDGQIHGGIAQGLGQALRELCMYDRSGQLLSGSFMDYALPRAGDLPFIESELDESQPCTHNPLGAKGCGEAGAIAAPAAIVGAVLDALAPLGVAEIEMPLTPEAVWRAISAAQISRST
jgi:carbon-monoxide dehydrogenase large subunit